MGTHTSRARASQRAYPYHYACPYPLHRATPSRSPLPLLLFLPNLLSPLRAPSPLPRCASSPSLFIRHPSPASPSPALAAFPLPSLLPRCLPLPFLSFPFPSSLPAAVVGGGDPGATKPLVRRGYQRRRSRGTGPIVTGLICAFMPCVFVCFMIVFFFNIYGDDVVGWGSRVVVGCFRDCATASIARHFCRRPRALVLCVCLPPPALSFFLFH